MKHSTTRQGHSLSGKQSGNVKLRAPTDLIDSTVNDDSDKVERMGNATGESATYVHSAEQNADHQSVSGKDGKHSSAEGQGSMIIASLLTSQGSEPSTAQQLRRLRRATAHTTLVQDDIKLMCPSTSEASNMPPCKWGALRALGKADISSRTNWRRESSAGNIVKPLTATGSSKKRCTGSARSRRRWLFYAGFTAARCLRGTARGQGTGFIDWHMMQQEVE